MISLTYCRTYSPSQLRRLCNIIIDFPLNFVLFFLQLFWRVAALNSCNFCKVTFSTVQLVHLLSLLTILTSLLLFFERFSMENKLYLMTLFDHSICIDSPSQILLISSSLCRYLNCFVFLRAMALTCAIPTLSLLLLLLTGD